MSELNILSGYELFNREAREIPKLLEPYILKKGLTLITGSSDCGKSCLIRQIAYDIVMGKEESLGLKLNASRRRVTIISTEDTDDQYTSVLKKMIAPGDNPELLEGFNVIFNFEGDFEALDAHFTRNPVDIGFVDTWGDLLRGDPNNFTSVRADLMKYKRLAMKHNCSIVIMHHNVKNSDHKKQDKGLVNGSQAIEATPRCVLGLSKGSNTSQRILTVLKSNFLGSAEKENPLVLDFNEATLTYTKAGVQAIQETTRTKYDNPDVLVKLMELKAEGHSFEKSREELLKIFKQEDVPGLTKLKDMYNENKPKQ